MTNPTSLGSLANEAMIGADKDNTMDITLAGQLISRGHMGAKTDLLQKRNHTEQRRQPRQRQ